MPGETPPSFSAFNFHTIGKSSLLSRLSEPMPLAQATPMDDEQQDDDLYVEMDVDSDTAEPSGEQPNLLARLSDPSGAPVSIAASSNHIDGTLSGRAPTPALNSDQARRTSDIRKQPATSADSSLMVTSQKIHSEGREDEYALTRPNEASPINDIADANALGPSSFPTGPIPLMLPTFSGLPTPPSSSSTIPLQKCHSTLFSNDPFTPARTNDSLFSQFPYTPLTELLNEERAAWGEVWETKRSHTEGTSNSLSVVSLVRAQASSPSQVVPTRQERAPSDLPPEDSCLDHTHSASPSQANAAGIASRSVTSVMSLTSRDEVSAPSTDQFVRKENNEADKTASSSVSVSIDPRPSCEVAMDDIISPSIPPKPPTSSPSCSAENQKPSSHAVTSRTLREKNSGHADEPHQGPEIDNVQVVSRQQPSTRSPSAKARSPRENELKAFLKARRTSQGVESKDVPEPNGRRSSRDGGPVAPMPVSPSRPVHSVDQHSGSRGNDLSNDLSGQSGSAKVLPLSYVGLLDRLRSVAGDEASFRSNNAHLLNVRSHNNYASVSPSLPSENELPIKCKSSMSPALSKEAEGRDQISKRQKKDNKPLKTENDEEADLLLPPVVKKEVTPLLPPTPTSAGSGRFFPTDNSAESRKRSRSSAVKAEDENGNKPGPSVPARPVKRRKAGLAGSEPRVKVEEEEAKLTEAVGSVDVPVVPQDLSKEPTRTMPVEAEGSAKSTDSGMRGLLSRAPDPEPQTTALKGHSDSDFASRISVTRAHLSSSQQQKPGNNLTAHISAPQTAVGISMQNDEPGVVTRISGPQSRSGDSEQRTVLAERVLTPQAQINSPHSRSLFDRDLGARHPPAANRDVRIFPERTVVSQTSHPDLSQTTSAGENARSPRANFNEYSSRESTVSSRRALTNVPVSGSDRNAFGEDVRQRGRSRERQLPLIDHWSPPRPQSGLVTDSYRPSRSPSPSRISWRTSDNYRRKYDWERTPPRPPWNSRRRSSSERRPLSPVRRSRSPPPRRAQRIYSRYSRSPPRRAIYSPSPPLRHLSPRQAPPPPRRQHADLRRSNVSYHPPSNHSGGSRSPQRNDTAQTSYTYPQSVDTRIPGEVRPHSIIDRNYQQYASLDRIGGNMLNRRNSGLRTHEPVPGQFGGNAPPADRQFGPYSSQLPLSTRNERANFSGSTIPEYQQLDAEHNVGLLSERVERTYTPPQSRQVDASRRLHRSGSSHRAESPDVASDDEERTSRRRYDMPREGDLIGCLTRPTGTPASQAVPPVCVAEPQNVVLQNHANRSALAEPRLNGLDNQQDNRYRYVDPIEHTDVGGINEDDVQNERAYDEGKADAKQAGENDLKQSSLLSLPHLNMQSVQCTYPTSSPHSVPVNTRAPVETHSLPTKPPSEQRQESSRALQRIQPPPTTSEQDHAQTASIADRLGGTVTHVLLDRISVGEPARTAPIRNPRESNSSNTVTSSSSRPPSLVSRLGAPPNTNESTQLADRFAADPVKPFSSAPSLISRFKNVPETSRPGSTLPPKPVTHHAPAGGGNGRAGRRLSPPSSDASPTLLGRMRSPGRESDSPHELQYVGRGGAGRGRARGHGGAQNVPRAARNSYNSLPNKPSLEDRFS